MDAGNGRQAVVGVMSWHSILSLRKWRYMPLHFAGHHS